MTTPLSLVSVIIITYNSSEFIIEALESIKNQTYSEIELLISDDLSKDDTVAVCEKWLASNHTHFKKAEIIRATKNTGVSGNLNRGVKKASGEWIKLIAGDDYLYPTCIETFLTAAKNNPGEKLLFCNVAANGQQSENADYIAFSALNAKKQYKELLKKSMLPAPGFFLHKEVLQKTNGFNERYRMLDDYPFMLSSIKAGFHFYHINESLVFYRVHNNSLSSDQNINIRYYNDIKEFYKTFYLRELRKNGLFIHYIHYLFQYFLLVLVTKKIIRNNNTYMNILSWGSILHWKLRIQNQMSKLSF